MAQGRWFVKRDRTVWVDEFVGVTMMCDKQKKE